MFSLNPTVDSVIVGLTKMVTDLDKVSNKQIEIAGEQRQIVFEANEACNNAEHESARAMSIAKKISELIS